MAEIVLAAFHRFWWRHVRRYDGEICWDCGRPVARCTGSWWTAPDDLWLAVMGTDAGVLCPPCFTRRAERVEIHVYWRTER